MIQLLLLDNYITKCIVIIIPPPHPPPLPPSPTITQNNDSYLM